MEHRGTVGLLTHKCRGYFSLIKMGPTDEFDIPDDPPIINIPNQKKEEEGEEVIEFSLIIIIRKKKNIHHVTLWIPLIAKKIYMETNQKLICKVPINHLYNNLNKL